MNHLNNSFWELEITDEECTENGVFSSANLRKFNKVCLLPNIGDVKMTKKDDFCFADPFGITVCNCSKCKAKRKNGV